MAPYQHFAIAGGTGNLGSKIARELLNVGYSVTLLSRSSAPDTDTVNALTKAGANVKKVDYDDVDTLTKSLTGVEVMINALGLPTLGTNYAESLALAASQAGVKLIVVNDWGVNMEVVLKKNNPPPHPGVMGKYLHRKYIEEIGLPWLAFSNGIFTSFVPYTFDADSTKRTASIPGSGNTPLIVTAEADVAVAVALAFQKLPAESLCNRAIRLVGQTTTSNAIFAGAEAETGLKWTLTTLDMTSVEAKCIDFNPEAHSFRAWHQLSISTGAFNCGGENDIIDFKPNHKAFEALIGPR